MQHRAGPQGIDHQAGRHRREPGPPARRDQRGEPLVGHGRRGPDVHLTPDTERSGDVLVEHLADGAVGRIDASHQFVLVEAERDGVVRLPLPGRPDGTLALHDAGQAIEIGHHLGVDPLVEGEEPGLVGQELADGDVLLAGLSELGPVGGHPLVVVEQAAGVQQRQDEGRQSLGGGVDQGHGVGAPGRRGRLGPAPRPTGPRPPRRRRPRRPPRPVRPARRSSRQRRPVRARSPELPTRRSRDQVAASSVALCDAMTTPSPMSSIDGRPSGLPVRS